MTKPNSSARGFSKESLASAEEHARGSANTESVVPAERVSTFRFRVSGIEDNSTSRRTYSMPYEEEFVIEADDVGDALNELVNRSAMWETLDHEIGFSIEYVTERSND